ncbi:MAG: two-component regulator propeller domain-containing protein [Prolixibacteraceae bacterium]
MRIYLLILILFVSHYVTAQNKTIKYLSVEQGLSQNEVTGILQDKEGFLWFATRAGLNRFDGYNFLQFKSRVNQENHLSDSSIECFFEDQNGNIWIGTKSGGLNLYNAQKETFNHILAFGKKQQAIQDINITAIAGRTNGDIFVGTMTNGLYILDKKGDSVKYLLENHSVRCIVFDGENTAWISSSLGLFKLDLNSDEIEQIDLGQDSNINEIGLDKDNKHLWITGWGEGLVKLNKQNYQWERYSLKEDDDSFESGSNLTYSLLIDSNNEIWVGTWGAGIYNFDRGTKEFSKLSFEPNFIGGDNADYQVILDIYEDRDNNIWIGADGGGLVLISEKKTFQGISSEIDPKCGLKNFHITAILETGDGCLWLGTSGDGLYRTFDNETFERIPFEVETGSSLIIKEIFKVNDDLLWVSTEQEIYKLQINTHKLVLKPVRENLKWVRKGTAFLHLSDGLLIGSQQLGLFKLQDALKENALLSNITPENCKTLKSNRITLLKKDSENNVWVGTYNGLYLYDIKLNTIIDAPIAKNEKLTSNVIFCMEQTSDSIIWVGTPSGLNKLTKKGDVYAVTHFYTETGLPDDFIRAILYDDRNKIWISSNSGIFSINIITHNITSFDKSDGLQGLTYSVSKGFKSNEGTLYFGGHNGFNYFKPADIEINKKIPPLVFTKFEIYNQQIKPFTEFNGKVILQQSIIEKPNIELSHKEKEFTIEFAALNYVATQRNNYKYKMLGYDDDWVLSGTKRSATYSNLRAGDYRFLVMGSNNNNIWNEEPIGLSIKIKPAPWKTWYAIIIYIAFIISLVVLITRNAIKQTKLANSLEMAKVKNEQETQLNEMKLRFFTNISHEFRTPLTLILGPLKDMLTENPLNKKLNVVYKNANRLMNLVNQLLEFRKIEMNTLQIKVSENNITDFVNEICLSFEELARINDIKFEKKMTIKTELLWFDIEKMEITLNNLIYNAFKYAGCGATIQVQISESENHIQLHVIDNGPGIPSNELIHIFDRFYQLKYNEKSGGSGIGLHLAKEMVVLHHGEIDVESIPNERTVFTVRLQKGNDHFSAEERLDVKLVKTSPESKKISFSNLSNNKSKSRNIQKEHSVLVVEDNYEVREYLQDLFEQEYHVEVAENGKQGFNLAMEKSFDFIISDVVMPKMDGMELCKRLKSNPNTSHIPVILLTAKTAGQFRLEGLKHGADAYISKPFDPDELKVRVETMLRSRKKLKEKFSKTILLEPTSIEISSHDDELIEKIKSVIEKNIENSAFTSEDLAEAIGMSSISLYRKLKSLTDQSSNELIRTIRLKRASQLLADPDYRISEVAYMVGFNDVKYFRKCFQKQFNDTPTGYRNKLES